MMGTSPHDVTGVNERNGFVPGHEIFARAQIERWGPRALEINKCRWGERWKMRVSWKSELPLV